jgi:predicted lipid-binding transport protein (Tim44 family)
LPTGEPFDPTLILLAALAVFVVWKLRSVLGVRTDRETPAPGRFGPRRGGPTPLPGAAPADAAAAAPQATPDRWKGLAEIGGPTWAGLDAIAAADPHFDAKAFVDGARRAYEMVVAAFAKGDRDALRGLLSKEVFGDFASEIARREENGETVETALVAIDNATVDAASATPRSIEITVRFASRLMTARRNRAGEVIEGGLDQTMTVVDLWTFARDPRSNDPNWRLVATRTAR